MAPKRNLQEYSLAAKNAKQKGKEILIEEEQVILKDKDSTNNRKDIPESSSKIDSSSESDVEDEEAGLDIWEREARRMFPPKEETNEWRFWTTQELAILEMEYMATMLDVVPVTEEIDVAELGPEVEFDMQYFEEEDIEAPQQTAEDIATDQKIEAKGIEDSESAKIPQEQKGTDAATVDADAQDVPSEDVAATVDASNAVADPSSSIPPANN